LPMKPGLVERPEYAYLRHGTQCLSAHFDGATGAVVAPTIGPSRTEEDFAGHIAPTLATAPEAPWLFIVDQLNAPAHMTQDTCRKQVLPTSPRAWTYKEPKADVPSPANVSCSPMDNISCVRRCQARCWTLIHCVSSSSISSS